MSIWLLYFLITALPAIKGGFIVFAVMTVALALIYLGGAANASDYGRDEQVSARVNSARKLTISGVILFVLGGFIPCAKDVMLITGGAYITQSEEVRELPNNAAKAVNKFLQEYFEQEDFVSKTDESDA